MRPGNHTQLVKNCLCPLLFCLFFVSWKTLLFPTILYLAVSSVCEYLVRFPLPDGGFLPCDHGLDVDIRKFNQSIKSYRYCLYIYMCVYVSSSLSHRIDQQDIAVNPARTGKTKFPCPRPCVRIWSRETVSAVPFRAQSAHSLYPGWIWYP